jgi:D-glycero-alpha-D-manno-heptose 1-phosphate guanylyltransferase
MGVVVRFPIPHFPFPGSEVEAIVLAGGLGTRLRAAVPDLPKPMAPVNGRPFLERLLDHWIGQGVTRIILAVGYRHEAISAHFGRAHRGVPVAYAIESRPRGTGGGLLLAADSLSGRDTFLVLNGDTYFEVPLKTLARFHASRRPDTTLALFRAPQNGRYTGLTVGKAGEILALGAGVKGGLANGGVYLMERSLLESGPQFASAPVSLEDDILPSALRAKRPVYGLECAGRFLDIGMPEDYARAADVLGA